MIYQDTIWLIWQYRLWSFQGRNTKSERFLAKINCSQIKLLNIANWCNGDVSKKILALSTSSLKLFENESSQYADKCIQCQKEHGQKKNLVVWIAVPPSQYPMFFDPGYFPQYFSFYTMLTYSRFFRVYDNQHVRPEVSKMAENSKRNISDPKTTRLLKFFKYRNIESTEIILNGFPRKDRGYLIEGNKYLVNTIHAPSWFETTLDYKPQILLKNFRV